MKEKFKRFNNLHRSSKLRPDIFIFGTARSGTTLMHEMVTSQSSFKPVKVPFDLRYSPIREYMRGKGINDWAGYYSETATPIIEAYIKGIQNGNINISDPFFFNNYNRWMTSRIAFKILHSCEERIPWFEETFNGKIVYMLRHPIPVSLSRRQIPRLRTFVESEYKRFFTEEQLKYSLDIINNGSALQCAVLDWALQNSVSLRDVSDSWTIVSYEQMVLDPQPILDILCVNLQLDEPALMLDRLASPSYSSKWSDEQTNRVLSTLKTGKGQEHADSQQWLIHGKWKERISDREEKQLMDILDIFELDTYTFGSAMPNSRYWLSGNSEKKTIDSMRAGNS